MSALHKYFDKNVNQASPVQVDLQRIVNYDEDGNEFVTYVPVDYPAIIERNGEVQDWSLASLLKAGINPNFPIRTGLNTRLEGIEVINDAAAYADSLVSENVEPKTDE